MNATIEKPMSPTAAQLCQLVESSLASARRSAGGSGRMSGGSRRISGGARWITRGQARAALVDIADAVALVGLLLPLEHYGLVGPVLDAIERTVEGGAR